MLALVVVKALADSPWGAFTVFATLPIAVFMGVYGRYLRPGRIGEMSVIGFVLLLLSIAFGRTRRCVVLARHLVPFGLAGAIAHGAVLRALGLKPAAYRFAHAAEHDLPRGFTLVDSYHCSRYNTNTRRLTTDMFRAVVGRAAMLARSEPARR